MLLPDGIHALAELERAFANIADSVTEVLADEEEISLAGRRKLAWVARGASGAAARCHEALDTEAL
jgi:hypothetical protein